MAEFVTIVKADDLKPGERLVFEAGRHWIVLLNVEGQYYALEDCCTHEEYPLSEGELDGHALECSKHGARFDVRDGKVLASPAFFNVKTYNVRVDNGEVQVEVDL